MSDKSSRRRLLIGLGVALVVAGIVVPVVLLNVSKQRTSNAIEGFARAPVGCDTTLDFVESGTYVLFLEQTGTLEEVRGDCDVDGSFQGSSSVDPEVQITDPDGNEIDLDRADGDISYDVPDFEGTSIFTVDIAEPNDHLIRVESSDNDTFVVAVGRDPNAGASALTAAAIGSGLAGLLGGLTLVILGSRRKKVTPAGAGGWSPSAPGTGPVYYGQPGQSPQGPPVYGQPGPVAPPQFPQQYPQQFPAQYPQQQAQAPYPPNYGQQPSWSTPPPPPEPSSSWPPAPHVPSGPADNVHPVDWSPSGSSPDTVVPDADYLARLQAERNRQQPPPPT
jgi:hypothetical protein